MVDAIFNSINIANTNILCEQVNVLTGKTISVDNLANMLIKEVGVKADKEYHNLSEGDPQKSEGTIRKMNELLGLTIIDMVPIKVGLSKTINSMNINVKNNE